MFAGFGVFGALGSAKFTVDVLWQHVGNHTGDLLSERADVLARVGAGRAHRLASARDVAVPPFCSL